jgi:hypothetical protein
MRFAAATGLFALFSTASATPKEPAHAVDLELLIAVDVSTSMSREEQHVQREGYVSALRSPEVMQAIKAGRYGRIAIAYMEWARPEYQRVLVPWTIIEGPADATAVAQVIGEQPSLSQGGTSISAALLGAGRLLRTSGLQSDRQVIDISGDGPNNAGPPIEPLRDALIARGVTVNGLAISLPGAEPYDFIESFPLEYVVSYYKRCVIGGPRAFVLAVADMADFQSAILQKFVMEIAAPRRQLISPAAQTTRPISSDCHYRGQIPRR